MRMNDPGETAPRARRRRSIAILSQAKGLVRDEIWKAPDGSSRCAGGATAAETPRGISQVKQQRRDKELSRPVFYPGGRPMRFLGPRDPRAAKRILF